VCNAAWVSGKGLKFGKIISLEMVLSSGRYLGQNNQKQRSFGRAKQPKTKELWKRQNTRLLEAEALGAEPKEVDEWEDNDNR
jgi:hypothetical protein